MTYKINGNVVPLGTVCKAADSLETRLAAALAELRKVRSVSINVMLEADEWLEGKDAYIERFPNSNISEYRLDGEGIEADLVNDLNEISPAEIWYGRHFRDIGWWEL